MRLVFMGSAALACPALRTLVARPADSVAAVVTQPDRPRGRRLKQAPSAIRVEAERAGLRVLTPERVNEKSVIDTLRAVNPDLVVVVAYGQILGKALLDIAPRGCVNVHASLLPAYRGAAPIQWAIARGETVTGVTLMFMNERMDAGDIILQEQVRIKAGETAGDLHDRLAEEGARALDRCLDMFRRGPVAAVRQDESRVSFAPKLSKADGRINWTLPAGELYNRIRGFNPWPCCFCTIPGGKGAASLRVLEARVEPGSGPPGLVLDTGDGGPRVAAGCDALRLLTVQPPGKKPMSGRDFLNGHALQVGADLGAGSGGG